MPKPPAPPAIGSAPPAPPAPAVPEGLRDITDTAATRTAIFDNVLKAASSLEPISNTRHTLALTDVHYADEDRSDSYEAQKKAILRGQSLGRRLRGTWVLTDNTTGQVVDQRRQLLARVPAMTPRGTFIYRGNEYVLRNQQRLRPGVFVRRKANDELEAHANVTPGKGFSHHYMLDPQKSVFFMRLGHGRVPMLTLLRALGADDKEIRNQWGPDIYAANYAADDGSQLSKLYERTMRKSPRDVSRLQQQAELKEFFEKMSFDPQVTKKTLGGEHAKVDAAALLSLSKKLLAVHKGEADVDDRDALPFQMLLGPEDLFSERIARDAGAARKQLLWKSSFKNSLKSVPAGALESQLMGALLSSGLGMPLEEVNAGEIFDKLSQVSRMGVGGIPSSDAIPQEARNVSPSQLNFVDPVRTPESEYAGVDTNLAGNVRKGPNGMMYAQYLDPRTGQLVWKSPQDVADLRVAFSPHSLQTGKHIPVMVGGRIRRIRRRDTDLVVPSFERAFSGLANMVPMKQGMAPQRMAMAARMITQALPLVGAQAPYVRTEVPGQKGKSFEEEFGGRFGAIRTDQPAIVQAVNPGEIVLRTADGKTVRKELAVHLPWNRKTGLHHTPVVQVGQQIPAGGMLARSNYTDDQGAAALGLNVRVGYLPYKGMNYEDAVVVSESLAKRLTSDHLYQHSLDMADDKTHFGKSKFMSIFAGKHSRKTLENFDKDGLIKPGTEVQHGDPLILAARERDTPLNKVHRRGTPSFSDASETWKHRDPGIVTDSMMTANGPVVVVKSRQSLQVADKLSGRYGNKGVVAAVIPDAKMPQDAGGQPLELILNPLGVISRGNPAQLIESALGKIAAKIGKPYTVPGFDDGGAQKLLKFAEDELARHGMSDTEDLLDPETERKIPGVFVGNTFIMKLHHQAEGKEQGRSTGAYSMDDAPAKGGEHGAKRIGLLDTNAIISHNAPAVLRDARSIRGQRNDDYWMQYLQGHTPTSTKPSIAYEKYLNQLRAGGLHIQADGPRLHIMALTQKDVDELAGDRELENADTVKGDEMLPIKGGLFDEALTGGHRGTKWAKITLPEPFPSPVMEEPIRRLLGLTQKNFEAVLAGKESIHTGTGPAAIQKALAAINVPRELAITRQAIQTGSRSARDEAVRKLGYLKSAQRLNIHPKDWMLNSVPVLPPRFRPVSQLGASGMTLVSDPNYLYRELLQAKNNLRSLQGRVEDGELGDERLAVYNAFKAVTGLGDPTHPKLVEKGVKGALASVFGSSPKYSTVQRKLIGSTVDNVGRGVIAPNPDFDMDTIGLPEEAAWNVYQKHILRALRRRGLPLGNAIEQWQNRSGLAREVLVEQLDSRPIYANRAPVLHKFGFMAFRPRLVQGSAIQISPLVTKGFGADFDGDTMQFHVPQDDEAAKEAAERMLPSRSLLSPADFKSPMYAPSQEYAAGLWESTREPDSKARTRYFASRKDAVAAYERGDIGVRTPVVILDED